MRIGQGPVNLLPSPSVGFQNTRPVVQNRTHRFVARATADKLIRKEGDVRPLAATCAEDVWWSSRAAATAEISEHMSNWIACRAELSDGSTLFVFGSEREAQAAAAQSPPNSAAPEHVEEAQPEAPVEAAEPVNISPEAAVEPAIAESGSSETEPAAEEHDTSAQQPAASNTNGPLTEDELSEMKASSRCVALIL